jgi:hypothetical protein
LRFPRHFACPLAFPLPFPFPWLPAFSSLFFAWPLAFPFPLPLPWVLLLPGVLVALAAFLLPFAFPAFFPALARGDWAGLGDAAGRGPLPAGADPGLTDGRGAAGLGAGAPKTVCAIS